MWKRILSSAICIAGLGVAIYFVYRCCVDFEAGVEVKPGLFFLYIGLVGLCILGICAIWALYFIFDYKKKLFEFTSKNNEWQHIGYRIMQSGNQVISNLPVAIILFDGNVIRWANSKAKEFFDFSNQDEVIDIYNNDITLGDISDELENNVMKLQHEGIKTEKGELTHSDDKEFEFSFKVDNKSYDVIYVVKESTLFIFDETERENVKKLYDEHIPCIAIISLDNIDNALKNFDVQDQSRIKGELLGVVSAWAETYQCHLDSLSGERLIAITTKQNLMKMCEDKFSISNTIRQHCDNNKVKSSISMGVACFDTDYKELGTMSRNLIDLAERRGGDQIVVNIQHEKIQYFGGIVNSQEKNTLVEARSQAMILKEAIEGSTKVLIMCHRFADCDAIGSMLAAYHLAISSKKDCKMVIIPELCDVTVMKILQQIKAMPILSSRFVDEQGALDYLTPQTLLIVTDTQSPKLLMSKAVYEKAERRCIVDHHRAGAGNDAFSKYISYYVETSASSTVELIIEMYNYYAQNIDTVTNFEASIMLAGIVVDTNNFTLRSGQRTFEAAGQLKTMGADMIYVRKLLQEKLDVEKMVSNAVGHVEIIGSKFAIVCLDEEDKVPDRTTFAKISDKLLTIDGVEASFTIGRINENTVGVSARSLGDTVNVQLIMENMNGGGHFNSAATQLTDVTIEEARAMLDGLLEVVLLEEDGDIVKIILTEDVKGKGKKNDVIDVANGYANHLIAANKAVLADNKNRAELEMKLEAEKKIIDNQRKFNLALKDDIDGKTVKIQIRVGANNKSYETVTKKLVIDAFYNQNGILIEKNILDIPQQINAIGIYQATVKLDIDIIAKFEINVEAKK